MIKNLKEEMRVLAEGKVEAYLEEDLALDFERMAELSPERSQYLWLLREHGTVLAKSDWLNYSNSPHFTKVSYYHPDQILAAYEVTVYELRGDDIFGTINPIEDYQAYYENLMNYALEGKNVTIGVFLTDGQVIKVKKQHDRNGFNYYRLLNELNLSESDVQKVRYLDFY